MMRRLAKVPPAHDIAASNLESPAAPPSERFLAVTHEVINQPTELADYNLYATDDALREAVAREGAEWASADLHDFGARVGAR